MTKSALEVYAMAVCLAAVLGLVGAFGVSVYGGLQITFPEFTLTTTRWCGGTRVVIWTWAPATRLVRTPSGVVMTGPRPQDPVRRAELAERRLKGTVCTSEGERRRGLQRLVKGMIMVPLWLAAFAVHWNMSRRARLSGPA
jgi:hypothetical protein